MEQATGMWRKHNEKIEGVQTPRVSITKGKKCICQHIPPGHGLHINGLSIQACWNKLPFKTTPLACSDQIINPAQAEVAKENQLTFHT